ncbi:hypothetical protein B0J12DRAFT_753162 [Macrophomina phaseolina]|uniref:Uncharacterized protein n=1 Tax=Macrophomina phaseolina TaxID=35725 RepID=A0ABQ8FQR5_9PEZI|nr:hypothetical protein B0J12DRAFT_753162 [Macrophomina phaseolina]
MPISGGDTQTVSFGKSEFFSANVTKLPTKSSESAFLSPNRIISCFFQAHLVLLYYTPNWVIFLVLQWLPLVARCVNNKAIIQEALQAQNNRQTRRTTRHELQAMNNALNEAHIISSNSAGGAGGGNLTTNAAVFNAIAAAISDEPSANKYNTHLNENVPPPPPAPVNKPYVPLSNAVEEEEEEEKKKKEDLPLSPLPPPPLSRCSTRARTPSTKA